MHRLALFLVLCSCSAAQYPGGARLARRGELPHYRLPDGAIRLRWAEVAPLVRQIPARSPAVGQREADRA